MNFSNSKFDDFTDLLLQWGDKLWPALLLLIVGLWLTKKARNLLISLLHKKSLDEAAANFIGQIVHSVLLVILFISVLSKIGVDTTSLIAALGAAGLAVALALKGSMENLAAGILLVSQRPFKKGDVIEGAGITGSVEKITILTTQFKTPDNKLIIVPNASLVNGNVTNYSTHPTRRLDLVVGVSYDDDIRLVKQVLQDILAAEPRGLKEPESLVAVSELADSSVNFTVRLWVNASDYWPTKFDLTEKIKLTFDEKGISIPFPQRDVHLYQHGQKSAD
ncbi:small conductance mechanosensitive channel [Oceanospirillum multiglobuliferum]|uniref:Small-conductance mechanosensitive channel n=1 Tax=Oceanospirillum multiglobuliferum TaxID=64969 RepID=A0A1T4SA97_9GAMM|nr:mechanosensitive ion channel domain-containing protein [Oceanospirillum multiglobuliferum]OPX54365.1 mechanosensitive ion channel protein [Oceanospirillum multiglobuliferum]SKA24781.1 small conductance mechanosensitive channel [Oceanospirillum multiglobuliferum]